MDESQLIARLLELGWSVGRSKSGRLLRVDNRQLDEVPSDDLVSEVVGCSALKEIYLKVLTLSSEIVDQLALLPRLKVLDLEGTDISDQQLQRFTDSILARENHTFQILNVRGTQVTEERVVLLRKKLINTRIIF